MQSSYKPNCRVTIIQLHLLPMTYCLSEFEPHSAVDPYANYQLANLWFMATSTCMPVFFVPRTALPNEQTKFVTDRAGLYRTVQVCFDLPSSSRIRYRRLTKSETPIQEESSWPRSVSRQVLITGRNRTTHNRTRPLGGKAAGFGCCCFYCSCCCLMVVNFPAIWVTVLAMMVSKVWRWNLLCSRKTDPGFPPVRWISGAPFACQCPRIWLIVLLSHPQRNSPIGPCRILLQPCWSKRS